MLMMMMMMMMMMMIMMMMMMMMMMIRGPWSDDNDDESLYGCVPGYRMPSPEGTPERACQLMKRCWDKEPGLRPHFSDITDELERYIKLL